MLSYVNRASRAEPLIGSPGFSRSSALRKCLMVSRSDRPISSLNGRHDGMLWSSTPRTKVVDRRFRVQRRRPVGVERHLKKWRISGSRRGLRSIIARLFSITVNHRRRDVHAVAQVQAVSRCFSGRLKPLSRPLDRRETDSEPWASAATVPWQ